MKKIAFLSILLLVKWAAFSQGSGMSRARAAINFVPSAQLDNVSYNDSPILDGVELLTNLIKSGGGGALGTSGASPLGNECVPDFTQDLSNDIAVSCNGEPSCETCFQTNFDKVNFYRRQLARLRCIYNNTKSFTDNAVAFGDNVSGIHAMTGLKWQQVRADILKNYKTMQGTYDRRYMEFMVGLEESLRELDTCMYIAGENNWYVKSGFIYYEFMQERYKRPD